MLTLSGNLLLKSLQALEDVLLGNKALTNIKSGTRIGKRIPTTVNCFYISNMESMSGNSSIETRKTEQPMQIISSNFIEIVLTGIPV